MIMVRRLLLPAALTVACASVRTPPPTSLPLRQVVLYSNGLGYFHRAGRLSSGHLSIQLRPMEIDDVLKTLAVQASTGTSLTGSAASTKRLDEAGQTQLDLTLPADRDVTVSYAAPSPPWQTVYKLMLDGTGAGSLETWATVANSSDEDWRDVHLTLATGAPFSNRIDLQSDDCRLQANATDDPAGAAPAPFVVPERTGPDATTIASPTRSTPAPMIRRRTTVTRMRTVAPTRERSRRTGGVRSRSSTGSTSLPRSSGLRPSTAQCWTRLRALSRRIRRSS